MAMDFPIDSVNRLPIFPEEASSALSSHRLATDPIGKRWRRRTMSCGSWGAACPGRSGVQSPARSNRVWRLGVAPCPCSQEAVEGPVHGDQLAVIQEHAESDEAASAQSTARWIRKRHVGLKGIESGSIHRK